MQEYQVYGKDGIFHNIVKALTLMQGRYVVIPKTHDLNQNNVLSGLDIPTAKYPLVACLPPISTPDSTLQQGWETISFQLLFLDTTYYAGDNIMKAPDFNSNSSLRTIPEEWQAMKTVALAFMNAMELQQPALRGMFRLSQQDRLRIIRISDKQNERLSGVMLQFVGAIAMPCDYTDAWSALPGVVLPPGDDDDVAVDAFVTNEVPLGLVNGSNATFTTAFLFVPESVEVSINGLEQKSPIHFTTSGNNTILFTDSPQTGDEILIDYIKL